MFPKLIYVLYVRKSTDVEDKQVLSIAAQIAELKEFAARMGIYIVDVIIEKETAKKPGRKKFNKMLERIEAGEANGILAWLPDRLSRNSIDSGKIIYMLDEHVLLDLKFPHFWFENTPQGKYMLANEFNSSKQYVDNLSVNTKRGLREKLRRGEYPSIAPFGYYNDVRTKTIKVDKRRAPLVVGAYELYAKNGSRFIDIAKHLYANGVKTKGGKMYSVDRAKKLLTNPFYYGHFVYTGEMYQGTHAPIMSKKLYDKVQAVIALRCFREQDHTKEPAPYCGLLRCSCGMSITAENKTKKQKNGNEYHYVYYRCSRKSKTITCTEKPVRSELLDEQLSGLLAQYALPNGWGDWLRQRVDNEERKEQAESDVALADLRGKAAQLSEKLQRLLDTYLDEVIERDIYLIKKAEIMGEKKSLEEQMSNLALGQCGWVEPMRQWLDKAVSICSATQTDDFSAKKTLLREILGLNLFLANKNVATRGDQFQNSPQKTPWSVLRTATKNAALSGDKILEKSVLEPRSGVEPETSSLPWMRSTN
jgi:site-specific DNA recombinase